MADQPRVPALVELPPASAVPADIPAGALTRTLRALFFGFSVVATLFYIVRLATIFAAGELFHRLGVDWSLFYAQAMVVRSGDTPRMYDIPAIAEQLSVLAHYSQSASPPLTALPVPYPPWFAAVLEPFTIPPPPIGFGLWVAVSICCALLLAYRVRQFLTELSALEAVARPTACWASS